VWAPTIIDHKGKYYLIFASNDIQSDNEIGGLEIAVADHPAGPFRGYLGKPLVDRFIHSAQPIDAHLFKDDDGTIYLYYGGWGHCNVAKMNDDMTGFVPFDNGETFISITPEGYVEGPCMLKKDGLYYLMWSLGGWGDGSYRVAYGVSTSPVGPFEHKGVILQKQEPVAEGPGHHGYLYLPETDEWLIVYHRRIIGETEPSSRILCIDRMVIEDGEIKPIVMTNAW
jgi:beta-xylosidase